MVYNSQALEFDVKQVQVVKDLTKASIVEASSIDANQIVVSWLAAQDNTTAAKDLIYTLHVSENKHFQASVDVRFINDLLINASAKGSLNDETTIIKPRKFVKVFIAGSVPIIVAG